MDHISMPVFKAVIYVDIQFKYFSNTVEQVALQEE